MKRKSDTDDIIINTNKIESLAPKYDADIKDYEDIITNALNEPEYNGARKYKNKNIAITGIYGAGKSTVIKSYFTKNKKYNVCYVSLGYYSHKDPDVKEQIEEINILNEEKETNNKKEHKIIKKREYNDDEIEKSILQQILFSKRPEIMSSSRFSRIDKFKSLKAEIGFSCLLAIFFSLAIAVVYFTILKQINSDWAYSFYIIQFLMIVIINSILIFVIMRRTIELSKVTFHNLEISKNLNNESVLNNNIDELIHYFLYNKDRIVVFEDLDRLPDSIIVFSKLKEINSILNSSIKEKTIQFIYAIGDTIFEKGEDKTKFFDIIIPIVPRIATINTADYLIKNKKEYDSACSIKDDYIKKIGRYIKDDRQVQQIINEYKTYLNRYNRLIKNIKYDTNLLEQDKNQLFYLICYKILYPVEFYNFFVNNSNISKYLEENLFINDIDYISQRLDKQEKKVKDKIQEIKLELLEKNAKLFFDGVENNINLNSTNRENIYKFALKFIKSSSIAIKHEISDKTNYLKDKQEYQEYIKLHNILVKLKIGEEYPIEKMRVDTFEEEQNVKFTEFQKMMLYDNVITPNYKRLISNSYLGNINILEERYLENINSKIKYCSDYKIENINELYQRLTTTDFYYDNICIDDIFDYMSKIDDTKKIETFLEDMNDYRFNYILKYTLSNRKYNIIKNHPELVDKLWSEMDLRPISKEKIVQLILFTLKYCKKDDINLNSYFYTCIKTYKDLDNQFEQNLDDIKVGLLNTLVEFNKECEYNSANKKFLDFIYDNKRFYGNIKLIMAIIKSRSIVVNNENFMTVIYNNKEGLYNLYEYTGPLFKKFFEECIVQIDSLENSDEVIKEILSNKIVSIEQKNKYLDYEKGKIQDLTTIDYIFLPGIVKNNIYEINWENLLYILNGSYDKYNELNILEKTFKVLQDNIIKLVNEPLSDSKKIILTDIILNKVKTKTSESKEVYLSNQNLVESLINNSYLITDNVSTAAKIYSYKLERVQIQKFIKNSFKYFSNNISDNIEERLLEDVLNTIVARQKRLDFYLNYQHIYNKNIDQLLFNILINGTNLKISQSNIKNIASRLPLKNRIKVLEKYNAIDKI